jgi:benzoate/toluate 1,2-dioxygenase beta subunit
MTDPRKSIGVPEKQLLPSEGHLSLIEDGRYVNEDLYQELAEAELAERSRVGPSDVNLVGQACCILFWEARVLDARKYRVWLNLLTEDFIYWVPGSPECTDPRSESAVNFDDRRHIVDRVALIETGLLLAQVPPSRTCRMISNVEAWAVDAANIDAHSNLQVWEHRRGRSTIFVGRQHHRLSAVDGKWLIRRKVIRLLDCDKPQPNTTFIL